MKRRWRLCRMGRGCIQRSVVPLQGYGAMWLAPKKIGSLHSPNFIQRGELRLVALEVHAGLRSMRSPS